jgi:hypothetical protein
MCHFVSPLRQSNIAGHRSYSRRSRNGIPLGPTPPESAHRFQTGDDVPISKYFLAAKTKGINAKLADYFGSFDSPSFGSGSFNSFGGGNDSFGGFNSSGVSFF